MGPNGAGKTTTIRMLAGVLVPTAGRVSINGIDLVENPIESKRHVGYIPDRPLPIRQTHCTRVLQIRGGMYGLSQDEVAKRGEELLIENGLLDRADELIEAYSHGMKQRLVLTSSLLHRPQLLIVDEPMVGLDPHGAKRIKRSIRTIAQEGRTVFLSTHSLDVAQEVCDRVGILFKGRLIALGEVQTLLNDQSSSDLEEVF